LTQFLRDAKFGRNVSAGLFAQVDFLTAMIFRISAAAELSRPALAETASNSFAVPVLSLTLHRHTRNAQAPLPKIDIRSQLRQNHSRQVRPQKPMNKLI
jgi:hypothetical protein